MHAIGVRELKNRLTRYLADLSDLTPRSSVIYLDSSALIKKYA